MEIRNLYDESKNLTDKTIIKGEKVPKGYYYLTVVVWIKNSNNEYLIQKTSKEKGSIYSTTGGHPTVGQTSLEGIISEIKEELGVTPNNELKLIHTIKTEDDFIDIYYLEENLSDFKLQTEEVSGILWLSKEKLYELFKTNNFIPSHIEFFEFVKNL